MFRSLLSRDPIDLLVSGLAILFTIVIHEYAHGLVALWNGDTTAEEAGRLTLNPISHIDPIGLLSLLVFRFGWAKPVPINPSRFTNERLGLLTTSLAGVTTNFLSAFIAAILLRFVPASWNFIALLLQNIMIYGVFFCVFNLIPIPPLDGSKVVMSFLPDEINRQIVQFEQMARLLLLFLLISGVLGRFISPFANAILNGMINVVTSF